MLYHDKKKRKRISSRRKILCHKPEGDKRRLRELKSLSVKTSIIPENRTLPVILANVQTCPLLMTCNSGENGDGKVGKRSDTVCSTDVIWF